MAKVITVSQKFPASHPKAGQPTHFVEKIWCSLGGVQDEYRNLGILSFLIYTII